MENLIKHYEKYSKIINDLTNGNANLKETIKKTENLFEFFEDLEEKLEKADAEFRKINNTHYLLSNIRDVSMSASEDFQLEMKQAQKIEHSIKILISEEVPNIAKEFLADKKREDIVEDIIEGHKSPTTFVLFILRIIHSKSDPQVRVRINMFLSELKNEILGSEYLDTYSKYNAVQAMLINAGLVPVSLFMTEAELLAELGKKGSNDIDTDAECSINEYMGSASSNVPPIFAKIKKTGISFILFERLVGSAMDFSIEPYISYKFVVNNDMVTKNGEGITPQFMKRFNIPVSQEQPKDHMGYVHHHINDNDDAIYVIETQNGKLFRFLSTSKYFKSINRDKISHLIQGLNTRHDDYNKLHEEKIVESAFDPEAVAIMKQFDNAGLTFNENDFWNIIKSSSKEKTMEKKVLKSIDDYFAKTGFLDQKKHSDSALIVWSRLPTFVSKYRSIVTNKEIEDKYRALRKSGIMKIPYRAASDYYKELFQ